MSEENKNVENGEVVELDEEIKTENEGIQISSDVVAVITGVAVSEVQGVSGMSGGFAGGITEVLSGKKNLATGIKVEIDEDKAKIDVNIIVEYGSRIPDVAFEIQNRVKKSVENMTGLKVEEVNVHVQGVNTDAVMNEKEDEQEATEENNTDEKDKVRNSRVATITELKKIANNQKITNYFLLFSAFKALNIIKEDYNIIKLFDFYGIKPKKAIDKEHLKELENDFGDLGLYSFAFHTRCSKENNEKCNFEGKCIFL